MPVLFSKDKCSPATGRKGWRSPARYAQQEDSPRRHSLRCCDFQPGPIAARFFVGHHERGVVTAPGWRIKAAQAALPYYVHVKLERPPATDPAATATQIEGESDSDPLAEAIAAFRRGDYYRDRIERFKAGPES